MKIFRIDDNKYKLFNFTIAKIKTRNDRGVYLHILGIPVLRIKNPMADLYLKFRNNSSLDCRSFDERISGFFQVEKKSKTPINNRIALLASIVSDQGGHSKCIRDLANSLSSTYNQKLYLTKKTASISRAQMIFNDISDSIDVYGRDITLLNYKKEIFNIIEDLSNYSPKVIISYIHPDDVFGASILCLIKKYINTKIIFFNHASHYPVLGMNFADLVLEGMPLTKEITQKRRFINNCTVIGLQSTDKNNVEYITDDRRNEIKRKFKISKNDFLTMSGGASYKFFDENKSDYFIFIRKLLGKEKRLKHLIISNFSTYQKKIIDDIFLGYDDERNRLHLTSLSSKYNELFQCADVFIDSFPVSSALTQIDLMRNRVPSVVKINKEHPEFSFHEYQMRDYPYMFDNLNDMENGIFDLLYCDNKRKEIAEQNFQFWLENYENSVVRDKYISIIEDISE